MSNIRRHEKIMAMEKRKFYFDDLDEDDDEPAVGTEGEPVSTWVSARRKPFNRESEHQCKRWKSQAMALLSQGTPPQRKLAAKLRCCSPSKPCASEACASCMYEFRARLLEQSISVVPAGGTAASVITSGLKVAVGALCTIDVKKQVRRLQKRISRSPLLRDCLILGGLDVSLNKKLGKRAYWQVHLYVLIHHVKNESLKAAVRETFPREPSATKPYRFRQLVDRLEAVGYSYKMHFKTRFDYINKETGELNVGDDDMPESHLPELLMFLDSYPIGGRMLLRGVRRHGRNLNLKTIAK